MRVNKLKLVQIFVEELMVVYGDLKSAQDDNSEGGSQITRREIWALIIDFICNLAPRLEAALLAKNGLDRVSDLRWRLIKALAEELKEIPAELESAKAPDSDQGDQISKAEAVEVVSNILKKAVPKIINQAEREL